MQQFRLTCGAASFDCLFSVSESPFILSLTSRGENPKFFKFSVEKGYWIREYFGEMYGDLVEVLRIDGRSGESLIPKNFLMQLDRQIPRFAKKQAIPSSEEIVRLRHDLEERDKPYFDTWIYWSKDSGRGPTKENLEKTRLVMGYQAYQYSIDRNASSKWSANKTDRTWDRR